MKDLTAFEQATGWKYSMTATNISKMTRIPGSHQAQWLDVLHRHHAVVEDRVRCNKAMRLHNLSSKSWAVNESWMLTREPRRRPGRLAVAADPARPGRPRRARHDALPAPPPPGPPGDHARRRWLCIEAT
jgi:hypothetical protein